MADRASTEPTDIENELSKNTNLSFVLPDSLVKDTVYTLTSDIKQNRSIKTSR